MEALQNDLVLQDLDDGQVLSCITQHPGFRPCCLEKWTVRLTADKYNTKAKQRYKHIGSEEK